MAVEAKYVRMYAPGGAALNFMGVTGNSHFAYPVSITMIKKALERGILVFEELAEPAEDGSLEVQLTLENYEANNGGKEVKDAVVVPDIEKQVMEAAAAVSEERLAAQGLEIKAKQEKIVEEYNKANGIQVIEGTGADPINPPGPNPDFPGSQISGGGDPMIDEGDVDDEGGTTGPTASGETMTEEEGDFNFE